MRPPRPTRGLPTSRAYWELKAEQMMNRVFTPDAPIDLDTLPGGPDGASVPPRHRPLPAASPQGPRVVHTAAAGLAPAQGHRGSPSPLLVVSLAALGGMALVGALSALVLLQQWTGLQRSLSQERNLLLVERLRSLGPATGSPTPPADEPVTPAAPILDPIQPTTQVDVGPDPQAPPPPEEAWMAALPQLPPTPGRPAPLRVPVSPRLRAPAPPVATIPAKASVRRAAPGPLPQLVGLVGAPGRAGSAIFQVGETSSNVNVGEPIGSSGWSLRAADAESVLIERGSEVRRLSIVAGG